MIDRSKEAEMAQVRILQALEAMKLAMPRVPEKFWDKYRQLISIDELQNRLVQVYDKHYTSDELNDLLKFYDSPFRKKDECRSRTDFARVNGDHRRICRSRPPNLWRAMSRRNNCSNNRSRLARLNLRRFLRAIRPSQIRQRRPRQLLRRSFLRTPRGDQFAQAFQRLRSGFT